MTLPPEQQGDRGQRYEVQCHGYPAWGWHKIGWINDLELARKLADAIVLAPGATGARVWERSQNPILRVVGWVVYETLAPPAEAERG